MLVVADSSPLIYLSRVRLLHVLQRLFNDVVVPRAVWDEAVNGRPSAPGIEGLRHANWIRIVDDPSSSADLGLDPGETAAILVAESLHADLLLIDERLGRAVAQERGLAVRGTLPACPSLIAASISCSTASCPPNKVLAAISAKLPLLGAPIPIDIKPTGGGGSVPFSAGP